MLTGLVIIFIASIFLGTFALPAKYIKNFAWENTWGAFFFLAMLVVPVGLSTLLVNGLWSTLAQADTRTIIGVIALGATWGAGFCMWGFGLSMVGLSLGYALTMGTMALCGSMLPFFMGHAEKASTAGGMIVILGILVCIVGVAINGMAGMKREKAAHAAAPAGTEKKNMLAGVIICVLAGLFSSGCNIAYHIGNLGGIDQVCVQKFGNPEWIKGLSVWTLVFLGGLITSFGFSAFRLTKNKTWKNFANPGAGMNIFLALLMAVGHFACLFFYGLGGFYVGVLGSSVGFAIFQSGSVLVGNALGFLTGEWKTASATSRNWLYTGLGVLIGGIVVVSIGNYMISTMPK
jgi:L-rhamnose-H+ transport protein